MRWVSAAQLASLDDLAADGTRLLAARPLLQPDTDYRLTLGTETAATTPAGTTGSVQYAFFRTGGPPADLRPYLASAVPRPALGPASAPTTCGSASPLTASSGCTAAILTSW